MHHRIWRLVLVAALLSVAVPLAPSLSASSCPPGHSARSGFEYANSQTLFGEASAEPLACELPVPGRNEGTIAQPALVSSYEVLGSYPHDPEAFLQGLVWHDGGFIYDRDTFGLLGDFAYQTEGWGLTYDGTSLIMSDGTDLLTFLDPESYQPVRTLPVTLDGRPLRALNELEWIEGEIWANVWQTDRIVRIDPTSGQVTGVVDLTGLLPPNLRTGREDVLNGIAYDPAGRRIFVGGKLWPVLFEIRVR